MYSHSSSSAIFERDIEPITSSSPPHPHHPPNPHRTPRSKATEQLDQSVPSVLDSAASILASSQGSLEDDRISVVAPANTSVGGLGSGNISGVASPIGSFRSRSPSPSALGGAGTTRKTSLLLSIPSPPLQTNVPLSAPQQASPPGTARGNLSIQTSPSSGGGIGHNNISTPSIVTPTSAYYSVASSEGSSPTTTTREHPPTSLSGPSQSQSPASNPGSLSAIPLNLSHPPSPVASASGITVGSSNADKRLSFMSYSDLLASTPASLQPLSSLTTSASSNEPPPHIPSVSGMTQSSAHSQAHSPSHSPGRGDSLLRAAGVIEGRGGGDRDSIGVLDDVGGEWEREGMGGGLEERLEALLGAGIPASGLTPPARA